jgi:hypothetical protein
MRKPIYLVGACALGATAMLVGAQGALVSSRANSATTASLAQQSPFAAIAATAPAMSAPEMNVFGMQQNARIVPEKKLHDMALVFPVFPDED